MCEQGCQQKGQGASLSERQCLGLQALGSNHVCYKLFTSHTQLCLYWHRGDKRVHRMLPSPRAQIKLHRVAVHDSVSYEQRKEERLRSGHIMVRTQCLCLCHIPLANSTPQNNSSREVQRRKTRFNGLSEVLMMI